jgi:hypothetical protein
MRIKILEAKNMAGKKKVSVPDYEKIVIYPGSYDLDTRSRLYKLMHKLGIQIIYERYG